MSFKAVRQFENEIAKWFGAPYAVAVDCCTHGLELALRYTEADRITVPEFTYLSVPMLADKLGIDRVWEDSRWENFYYITPNIIDAAVYWKENSYIDNTFMVLSFQFKKHLNLGRGGMILTDNEKAAIRLRSMAYDGRLSTMTPWDEQDITEIGYHYYMTPETAIRGLADLEDAKVRQPRPWSWMSYPYIRDLKVFSNGTR